MNLLSRLPRHLCRLGSAGLLVWSLACGGGGGGGAQAGGGVPVPSAPDPVITSFEALASPVAEGGTASLRAAFANGTAVIDHGVGAVSSGETKATNPLVADTTFTLTVTGGSGRTAVRTVVVAVAHPPLTPVITVASSLVSEGATALTATVPAQAGCAFAWTIQGGTFSSGASTASGAGVTFTAGAPGTLRLSCTATNGLAQSSAAGTRDLSVVALPVIGSFAASKSPVTAGAGTTLTAVFSGGPGALDHGLGAVSSSVAVATGPLTADTTYTLVVTNAAGAQATATATVRVVAMPAIASFTAGRTLLTKGGSTTLTAVFTGGVATLDHGLGSPASGGSTPTGALSADTSFTLTVTNEAGTSVSANLAIQAVDPPVIQSFTASPAAIGEGQTSTLGWSTTGAVALSLAPDLGTVTGQVSLGVQPVATTTYTLTATNAAGDQVTAQAAVTVTMAPPTTPAVNLAPYFTAGKPGLQASTAAQGLGRTYLWTVDNGTITSGQGTPAITFRAGLPGKLKATVQVTNAQGSATGEATADVVPAPVASLFAQDRIFHDTLGNQASVPVQPGVTYQWILAMPGGAVTSGAASPVLTYQAGAPMGSYTLTVSVQNQAGDSASETRTLQVVGGRFLADPTGPSTVRTNATASLLPDGRVLLAGGYSSQSLTTEEVFDPATTTWAPVNGLADRRWDHAAIVLPGGKVLVSGGQGPFGYLATCELYDPATRTWSPAAAMATARKSHAAALLQDGRVLVVGGEGPSTLASAELYDPQQDRWTPAGSLATPRTAHQATRLPDGRVLVTGGYDGALSVAATEAYDPVAGTWSAGPSLATGRHFHSATLLPGGGLLVTGGMSAGNGSMATSELLPPGGGAWAPAAPLGTARFAHSATLLASGKVLVAGGVLDGTVLASSELYDPALNAWSSTGALAKPRWFHAATILADGSVLAIDGTENQGPNAHPMCGAERYDPVAGTWSGSRSMVHSRIQHTATLLGDGRLLVVGGDSGFGDIYAHVETYDAATRTWQAGAALATARRQHTATRLLNGRILVVAGRGDAGPLASAELYDPATGTWSSAGSLGAARLEHTATLLADGRVLVAGGSDGTNSLAGAEVYDPAANHWTPVGSLAVARRVHAAALLPTGKVLVSGGIHALGGPDADVNLASTELFDPATGLWAPAAPLVTGRNQHESVTLADGKVLVAGGTGADGFFTVQTETYDPATNAWTPCGPLTRTRFWHTLTLLPGGEVILVGGYGIGDTALVERFSPATRTWSPSGSLGAIRYQHTTNLMADGTVMVVGGVPFTGAEFWRD